MNDRLYQALAAATGESLARTPQTWWSWWDNENGVAFNGGKQTGYRYFQDVRMYQDLRPPTLSSGDGSSGSGSSSGFSQVECFVAGTPVWTIAGAVDIENIRVGDLVLSQDPNTGELAFQPVLQTSQRPPERLVKVRLATGYGDTLEGSGGHPLWVAGDGWVKLRDLQSGMVLHGVDGTTMVSDVEPGSTQRTYNLIVDNFHTYLVGERRLLCHDNTPRRPTSAIVPGLMVHLGLHGHPLRASPTSLLPGSLSFSQTQADRVSTMSDSDSMPSTPPNVSPIDEVVNAFVRNQEMASKLPQ